MKSHKISRRLFSTLQSQLQVYESILSLYTIPRKGRAIIAAKTLDSHTPVIQESPIAAVSFLAPPHACRHCLKPIPPSSSTTNNHSFCSTACKTAADNEWYMIDKHCNFDALTSKAKQQSTKFPLLAARLAAMKLQSQLLHHHHLPTTTTTTPDSLYPTTRGTIQDLNNLCFVNNLHNNNNNTTTTEATTIPEEWRVMHHLLTQSLWPVAHIYPQLASYIHTNLDIGWYTWLMSRLHVNVFRIDIVAPLMMSASLGGGGFDRAALLKAAVAAVDTSDSGDTGLYSNNDTTSESESSSSQQQHQQSGTGVYALASMFNHSCDPNLDVLFPDNNSTLCLQTAREVIAGEELTISYIDAVGMGVEQRRQYLKFAYGIFDCNCVRCQEEGKERDKH